MSKSFIDAADNFVLDCDGVLWRGDNTIVESIETVRKLKEMGKGDSLRDKLKHQE